MRWMRFRGRGKEGGVIVSLSFSVGSNKYFPMVERSYIDTSKKCLRYRDELNDIMICFSETQTVEACYIRSEIPYVLSKE